MLMSRYGFFLSGILCVVALLLFLAFDLNYGIDFKGGTLIEIKTPAAADLAALRSKIGDLGLGDAELQEFGGPSDVLIRLEAQAGGEAAQNERSARCGRHWVLTSNFAGSRSWARKCRVS